MSKHTKIWLIIAAALILIGCSILGGVTAMLKWDLTKLSTDKYQTNTHKLNEEINFISVNTDTADIDFVPSENSECSVVCYEQENVKHSVTVKDSTLAIEVNDTRRWYEHIGINFGTPKITVYIPAGEYSSLTINGSTGDINIPDNFGFKTVDITVSTGDVKCFACATEAIKISSSTGDIFLKDLSAGSLELSVSTGTVTASSVTCGGNFSVGVSTGRSYLTDITCKTLISSGDTGDISLKNVIAEGKISIERSTGDVTFERCDASELFVETDTGDVTGSLLSEKIFTVKTDTGEKDVPNTTAGGRCEITTDTGDVRITVEVIY